jgi:hypothetical protein
MGQSFLPSLVIKESELETGEKHPKKSNHSLVIKGKGLVSGLFGYSPT